MIWWRRKPKNRRFEREGVLEVKMRSQHVRAWRVRLATTALAASLGFCAVAVFLWQAGAWALDEFVFKNEAFAIETIDVETDGVLSFDQLRKWAGVKPGDNLLALDLARVKRDLELAPWIQSAAVQRILPRTLQLRISEREPVAQIYLVQAQSAPAGQFQPSVCYLDGAGCVMLPLQNYDPLDPMMALPTLTGIKGTELRPGRPVESAQIQAALRLLADFEHSPMLGLVDLKSIDLSSPQTMHVTTAQGSEVILAMDNLGGQLRRWRTVHDFGSMMAKAIGTLDLAVSNYVPARWLEASAVPAVKPKLNKPSLYRKKNV
ncbi:MAG: FtsQ-type POTRA domain-containing protein [Verrucomicrobiota bacterium]